MSAPPSGTVTFLFTDIEGSTRRWDAQPEPMKHALARHDAILRDVIEGRGGYVFKTVGDSYHAAFSRPEDALAAAVDGQRALAGAGWGGAVRMALHTGSADEREGDYFGPPLNHVARLLEAGHGGQVLLSGVTADLVRDRLPAGVQLRDLGEHRLRDVERPLHIYQLAIWGLPADFPPLRTADGERSTLPVPLTSFVGREREIEEVAELFETARLVTFSGPGGTGKTRLALAVAERLRGRFPDGAVFVDLSAVADPALVAAAVARALGMQESGMPPLTERLQARLAGMRVLLVLDNFEQVLDAAPLLTDLARAAPGLALLVTSRAALRLSGEREYPVAPLPTPDVRATEDPTALHAVPSVALFLDRARAVRPDFALTTENAASVAAICARLDGLPLAIELAAARVKLLPPQALLARLDRRLPLLTGGGRDRPERQQTLRDTIRWSYDLLSDLEQTLFRRLSVFAGGWTIDAAEALCAGDEIEVTVLDGLGSLVDKSLVQEQDGPEGEPRFTMLATIREFGLDELAASGEERRARERHAGCFVALVEAAEPRLRRTGEDPWLARLDADLDNLRAALGWLLLQGEAEAALRLAAAARSFWYGRGLHHEGHAWLARALAVPGAQVEPAVRAKALTALGFLAQALGWSGPARAHAEGAVALYEELGDREGLALAHWFAAMALLGLADPAAARMHLERSLALAREQGDQLAIGSALRWLGVTALYYGDLGEARVLLDESLALGRTVGDLGGQAHALQCLAALAVRAGDLDNAETLAQGSLALFRRRGQGATALLLSNLATVALERGDAGLAAARSCEAVRVAREQGDMAQAAACLGRWAQALAELGEPELAVRLLGAADAAGSNTRMQMYPESRARWDRWLASLRDGLGAERFDVVYRAGRALSLDAAFALALEQTAST